MNSKKIISISLSIAALTLTAGSVFAADATTTTMKPMVMKHEMHTMGTSTKKMMMKDEMSKVKATTTMSTSTKKWVKKPVKKVVHAKKTMKKMMMVATSTTPVVTQ